MKILCFGCGFETFGHLGIVLKSMFFCLGCSCLILLNSYSILLWVSVFDMTEAQVIVMAEAKTSMFRDDDMPKSITSKKIEWFKLSSLGTCCENNFARQTNVEIFDK